MNDTARSFWEADPHWRERLINATRHRAKCHLVETAAWTAFDPRLKPKNKVEWDLTLFAALASGMSHLAEEALRNGASPTDVLRRPWLGAMNGELVISTSTESVYYWVYSFRWQLLKERISIITPLQTAVAGGCHECIALIIKTGVHLQSAIDWLRPLRFDVPRIKSALAIGQFVATNHNDKEYGPIITAWTQDMEKWLRHEFKRVKNDRTERETIAGIYRQLLRVSESCGCELRPSSRMLAELL